MTLCPENSGGQPGWTNAAFVGRSPRGFEVARQVRAAADDEARECDRIGDGHVGSLTAGGADRMQRVADQNGAGYAVLRGVAPTPANLRETAGKIQRVQFRRRARGDGK